jgi:hypothetical protein
MAISKGKTKMILGRVVAVFAASGLSVVGAGAIAGVELWQAILMAGIGGVATVVEGLSRAYLQDGKLTTEEINEVFNAVDKKNSARKAASSGN